MVGAHSSVQLYNFYITTCSLVLIPFQVFVHNAAAFTFPDAVMDQLDNLANMMVQFEGMSKPEKAASGAPATKDQEEALVEYLESIDEQYSRLFYNFTKFEYDKAIGNEVNDDDQAHAEHHFQEFSDEVQDTLKNEYGYWRTLKNLALKREVREWLKEGVGNFSDADSDEMRGIEDEMKNGYKKAAVCPYKSAKCDCDAEEREHCTMTLDPEIERILEKSRDPEELKYYWTAWHDAVGRNVKASQYARFLELKNLEARSVGYTGNQHVWASDYDTLAPDWTPDTHRRTVNKLWGQFQPKYKILHAYVRMKLSRFPAYKGLIHRCGHIPLHLLNNLFGQTWTNIDSITKPYPKVKSVDATEEMRRQGYTVNKIVHLAEEAFVGMGLEPLPEAFWNHSVFEKREGGEMTCHPTAWDMGLGRYGADYRVSMCASVNQRDMATLHHELGHVQYMIQSAHLRYALRGPANPGFDESIGDVLAMAVNSPEHLQCVLKLNIGQEKLCGKGKPDYRMSETDVNYLFMQAMELLAFLPFAYAMDSFREMLMMGFSNPEEFNTIWWMMREDIQGVVPPEPRSEKYFDPAAKYHFVVHQSYFRYFLSTIVQFQLFEGLCIAAGQYSRENKNGKPLYRCDFLGSKKAGKLFGDLMKVGKSSPWPEALSKVTGYDWFCAGPMLRYFEPLFEKLKEFLKEGGEFDCLEKPWKDAK